jgi:hypothetical protein
MTFGTFIFRHIARVDDWDKTASFDGDAFPRRSTSSLDRGGGGMVKFSPSQLTFTILFLTVFLPFNGGM